MSKKSISVDVKAANSKLAIFLRRKEEEEASLGIGKRKPKKLEEEKKRLPGGRARWSMEPDFRVPTPMVDRPRTESGATSFHFSYITISKEAVPTHKGQPVEGPFGKAKEAALKHSKYIERDGAPENSLGVDHAAYVERPGAVEIVDPSNLDPSALISEAVERTIATVINETPTNEEAAVMGDEQLPIEGIPSVFSNISDDPFERQEFWRAVERCEREPRVHEIILEPDINPRWWQEIETTNFLDPSFKNHALTVAEAYRQWLDTPAQHDEEKKPFRVAPFKVSAARAGEIIMQAQKMKSFDFTRPPFEFKSGRGGRVQIRMVAELPHEISPEDRALIVQNFCDHLASLEERRNLDGKAEKAGLMYTAVIHAPDAHNDRRNYHLHIVAYDRPSKFLDEHGQWDFEVAETYLTSRREERVRYPHRQHKIGEVSQGTNTTGKANSGVDFIPGLRKKFADITNTVLLARGIDRKYDHRKYVDMGIDRTPTEHLGTKAAALEAIGVPTIVGQMNAAAIWSDAERQILRRAKEADKAYRTQQSEIDRVARAMTGIDPNSPSLKTLRQLAVERAQLIVGVAEDRKSIMTFDHMEAKAKSRAVRTRQTCLQFLADIEAGQADRNTRIMKNVIRDRWKAASDHIAAIDKALAPHRDALATAARDIEKRESRISEIDQALQPILTTLERQIATAAVTGLGQRPTPSEAAQTPSEGGSSETPEHSEASQEAKPVATPPNTTIVPTTEPKQPAESKDKKSKAPADKSDGKKVKAAEPVKPVSIEGFPIAKPTIGPEPKKPEPEVPVATPEGLTPLRPMPKSETTKAEPQVINEDITQASPEGPGDATSTPTSPNQRDDGERAPESATGEAGKDQKAADPDAQHSSDLDKPSEPEPKVDGRRKIEDPKLFETPEQMPPVKPGTTRAEYEQWSQLLDRISRERVPIKVIDGKGGTPIYKVPSLSPEEQELLQIKRLHGKTIRRLAGIADTQRREIDKVVRWINKYGQDPNLLILEGRSAKVGNVTKSVRTLFGHWGRHAEVTAALQAEHNRRVELAAKLAAEKARQAAKPKAPATPTLGPDWTARKVEAERVYPTPENVYTPEVKEFTRLLRELAPEAELQAAADKIYTSNDAREDVQKHTPELAVAYAKYSDGYDARMLAKARGERSGKGGR